MISPDVQKLFDAILTLHQKAGRFDGVIVRSVATRYANKNDFFSGTGAAKTGGRWNPVGLQSIYASLDIITATEEAYQNFNSFGFPLTAIQPRVTAGAKASLNTVLDLTETKIRRMLGFSRTALIKEDWKAIQNAGNESWTQTIGRGCFAAGFEGLIAPSARRNTGKNIVIFPQNIVKPEQIEILASDQLIF